MGIALKLIVDECNEYENCDFHCPFYDRQLEMCEVAMTPDNWDLERIANICLSLEEANKK